MFQSKELFNNLKNTELFAHVPDDVLTSISDKMELLRLPAGKVLFNEGEFGDTLYLIIEGELAILSDDIEIVTRRRGECVGELALLDPSPRNATVKSKTDSSLLKLHRNDFNRTLASSWEAVCSVFKMLVRKLRAETEQKISIIREQERLQQDFRRAYEIQTAMLPSEDLTLDWVHLAGKSQPAADVGGDYYDYFSLPDGCVSVAIGDVVGHGFYSSLLVAIASSALKFQVEKAPSPQSVLNALNKVVLNYRHTRMLMTFAYMLLNPSNQTLTFANAGHPYPYLYRHDERKWTSLEISELPLGALQQSWSRTLTVEWKPGDRLFLYSDGIIETQNEKEEMYGFDSLERLLYQHASISPGDMISAIYEELDGYRNGCPIDDDVTVVVVQFL